MTDGRGVAGQSDSSDGVRPTVVLQGDRDVGRPDEPEVLLRIEDLRIESNSQPGAVLVDGVSLVVKPGEVVGLVGETGAGKSLTARSALGLLPKGVVQTAGRFELAGRPVDPDVQESLRDLCGNFVSLVVQNPVESLNPMLTIAQQLSNAIRAHRRIKRSEALAIAQMTMASMGFPDPAGAMQLYSWQMSGGMAQRAMTALSLVNQPSLLIADEPTTALDSTVQADILDLIVGAVADRGASLLIITHDLGIVATYTDRCAVMFAGQVVESADTQMLFEAPAHPYTRGLLHAAGVVRMNEGTIGLEGSPPNLASRPAGCQFAYRCAAAVDKCLERQPDLVEIGPGHWVRCWRSEEWSDG